AHLRRDIFRRRQRRGRETVQERSEGLRQLSRSQQRRRERETRDERAARERDDAERIRRKQKIKAVINELHDAGNTWNATGKCEQERAVSKELHEKGMMLNV
ncbi:hypothetical protein V3C99_001911, partial [Haemonchus contortus]